MVGGYKCLAFWIIIQRDWSLLATSVSVTYCKICSCAFLEVVSLDIVYFDIRYTVLMFANIILSKVIKEIFYFLVVSCQLLVCVT
jgi:hypothetical protein